MRLKEYESADRKSALSVYLKTFAAPPFNYDWLDKAKADEYFADIENTPKFKGYLFYDGEGASERLVGVCLGTYEDYFQAVSYNIKEIVIAAGAQGRGAGSAFIAAMAEELKKFGVTLINITTQRTIPAFEFYKKNEFVISDDTVTMVKFL